jgi:putative oxidoreductase
MAAILSFLGRLMLCSLFFLMAVRNYIPDFKGTLDQWENEFHVPHARYLLIAAILVMTTGSVSIILGYRARFGAFLLFVFLGAATYLAHRFWEFPPESVKYRDEMIIFLKNVAIAGAMVFIIANGPGRGSLDAIRRET